MKAFGWPMLALMVAVVGMAWMLESGVDGQGAGYIQLDAYGDKDLQRLAKGRYLLTFWSRSCGYCKEYFKEVDRAVAQNHNKALQFQLARVEAGTMDSPMGTGMKQGFRHWGMPGLPSTFLVIDGDRERFSGRRATDLLRLHEQLQAPAIKYPELGSAAALRNALSYTVVTFLLISEPSCPSHQTALADFQRTARRFSHRAHFATIFTDTVAARQDLLDPSSSFSSLFDNCAPIVIAFQDSVPSPLTAVLPSTRVFAGPFQLPPLEPAFPAVRSPLMDWTDGSRMSTVHWLTTDQWDLLLASRYSVLAFADPSDAASFDFIQHVKEAQAQQPITNGSYFWLHPQLRPSFPALLGCLRFPCLAVYEPEEAQFWRFTNKQEFSSLAVARFLSAVADGQIPGKSALQGFGDYFNFYGRKFSLLVRNNLIAFGIICVLSVVALVYLAIYTSRQPEEQPIRAEPPRSVAISSFSSADSDASSSKKND